APAPPPLSDQRETGPDDHPTTTASALAPPARGRTVTIVAKRRPNQCQERLERFTQRARGRRGQPLGTTARLVPVTGYSVTTAAPGLRLQVVPVHQAEHVLAEAAPATRRPRMSRPG